VIHGFQVLALFFTLAFPGVPRPAPSQDPESAALIAEELRQDALAIRRGQVRKAISSLEEILAEDAGNAEARLLLAEARWEKGDPSAALADAQRARADSGTDPDLRARSARTLARFLVSLGRPSDAIDVLEKASLLKDGGKAGAEDARDAWALGSALWEAGKRARAKEVLSQGTRSPDAQSWRGLLARGLCERRLGDLESASKSFVEADLSSRNETGTSEPDVLAALGDLYFEADREVEAGRKRSAADLYHEALKISPGHEASLVGLFRLHRTNWLRQSRSASDILEELLALKPSSIEGLIAAVSADLDDGQLKSCREKLSRLDALAPGRREVRGLHAALAFVTHDDARCEKLLGELAEEDPLDGAPEREVGRHLSELYVFAEALPFEKRATQRDERDFEAWKELGRAMANLGDEDGGRAALDKAAALAEGRQDAWRDNLRLVLKKMSETLKREKHGDLTFAWNPAAADVLRTYLVPFYSSARAELCERYGHTPAPTTIEVFDRHADFSVRSTGFEGFPALGVCFGPVVTSVSPLSELRGTQSWARTSFHEFTHVIHLDLSHNRCPRWITEGIATWEEENRNPTWTRNMRRELVDAIANGDVIPVRELNRAFRSHRILFGYYQGGLLVRMLIERRGFPPIVRILQAFDRGLDIDQALAEIYQTTPEALDKDFDAFVRERTAGLAIEPRWTDETAERVRAGLARERPPKEAGAAALDAWADGWCTVAWHAWQSRRRVDAQEALRKLQGLEKEPVRAQFLRGEMALQAGDPKSARTIWKTALEHAEDFRVRIALGSLAADAGEHEEAEKHFLAAEKDFPGFDEEQLSAELRLSKLYALLDRKDDSLRALERRLDWDAGNLKGRLQVAAWHFEQGRFPASAKRYGEANEIDPFRRSLHRAYGEALKSDGKFEEALREFTVGPKVPADLDANEPEEMEPDERAEWLGLQAACLQALGRGKEASERAKKALEIDPDSKTAREVLEKVQ
jgi:tetratricopeptide (TPR) repeat protein